METLHYTDSGLDNIFLVDGFEEYEGVNGPMVKIQNLKGLHNAIAMDLAESEKPLNGAEARFLRIEMGWTQKLLAQEMGLTVPAVKQWEKQRRKDLHGPNSTLIKGFFIESRTGRVSLLDKKEKNHGGELLFCVNGDKWSHECRECA